MYTSKAFIQKYMLVNIDSSFDDWIDEMIGAADAFIDAYCNTTFSASASEIRYFDGNGKDEIIVDDLLTVTELKFLEADGSTVDDTISSDDYFLYPYNATPKHKIILSPEGDRSEFPIGTKRVKITGTWGHKASVPADIKLVSTMLVAAIIEVGKAGEIKIKKESIGDYSVEYGELVSSNLEIETMLNRHRVSTIGRK